MAAVVLFFLFAAPQSAPGPSVPRSRYSPAAFQVAAEAGQIVPVGAARSAFSVSVRPSAFDLRESSLIRSMRDGP